MRQEERRARTIGALLHAARLSFATCGYDRSSLDTVASSAGLSKGAVYVHFPTKQALFLAVARETLAEARDRVVLLAADRRDGADPAETAREYFRQSDNDHEHVGLLAEVFRVALDDEDVRAELREHQAWRLDWLTQVRDPDWGRAVALLIDGEAMERRVRMAGIQRLARRNGVAMAG